MSAETDEMVLNELERIGSRLDHIERLLRRPDVSSVQPVAQGGANKRLFSVSELMTIVPVGRSTLYREMSEGRLTYVQSGQRRMFEPEAIDTWIALMGRPL